MGYYTNDYNDNDKAERAEQLRRQMNERGYDVVRINLSPGRPHVVFVHRCCSMLVWNPDAHDWWHASVAGEDDA